ncbi:hypothetical protein ABL78_7505 [Leptomonas seymouri]|uniref:Uncharacterized protein n=1 Tax=Leptomonas seymouri TaxID=5684 RepID=A0A0N0P2X2_LEPSE|nr:hypothetical protein ABL78_7505 [Leptomonas seymouri]|eukprot:KPI83459.1 hypothetical protein ABL78_7505 [Leptomonas seymouri]
MMEPSHSAGREAPQGEATAALSSSSSPSVSQRRHHRHRSLLSLDVDAFDYLCSFIPVDDLLFHLTTVSREARRRVWANHKLWQQLWMRYLVQFFKSLIPPPKLASPQTTSAAAAAASRAFLWPAGVENTATIAGATSACSDAAWRLYHYHLSKEARPRVELLERLRVTPEDITDPPAAEVPTKLSCPSAGSSRGVVQSVKVQEQTLLFAQVCATQLVADNLTHTETPDAAHLMRPVQRGKEPDVADTLSSSSPNVKWSAKVSAMVKGQQRQAERLRRALHFLLSASGNREAFHDRLWSSTYEAGEAYRREESKDAVSIPHTRRRRRKGAKANALADKDQLRPLSWLDDRDNSVKVLLFDDNSRSVGDTGSVQAERIKLLGAIAHHWRLAYAHQFYLTPTDGKDHGSAHPRPFEELRPRGRHGGDEGGAAAAAGRDQDARRTHQDGRVSWELVYRRFRDDNANVRTARMRNSLRQVAVAGDNDGRMSRPAAAAAPATESANVHVIPSSGNPLFDMHLLTFSKRQQFYAAMMTSTVEVPDGMGAFFATCVSESFLRWWCWRSRRLTDILAAGTATRHSFSAAPTSTTLTFPTPPSTHRAVPTTLWIARVCSVHKPQYGTKASDGSFGRPAPIEAEESIVYTSSYSDVTSTDTLASDSSSIDFIEELPEEVEEGVDAYQPYPDNGTDGNGDSNWPQMAPQRQQQQLPLSALPQATTPRVALLFPLPHMLAYWFMMHHVTFYSHQVYRRMWGDQEITIAVCSRILSPTGHSVECRLFYTLRYAAFPRMYTKMMFTPGTLPALTLQDKMASRSPYRSPSATSASSTSSSSEEEEEEPLSTAHPPPHPSSASAAGSLPTSSKFSRVKHTTLDSRPVDSRQVYDLFWTGFGRVEVESGPTISRSNLVRLRVALGLPIDFPMGLLWNVLMFASGVGPLILKDHRHSLYFNYPKSFTDVVEEEFGEVSCYGYGARPRLPAADRPMPNPLDTELERMREQRNLDEAARALEQGMAPAELVGTNTGNDGDADASFSTAEREDRMGDRSPSPLSESLTSTLTTSPTAHGSLSLNSDFSSMGEHSTWSDWLSHYSGTL